MKLPNFSEKDKSEFFDFFYKKFYYMNFGSMSKSDIEVFIFHFLIKKLRVLYGNGYSVDETKISDFKLACQLGVTPQKIRSLKMKERLLYPNEKYDWRKQFLDVASDARYDADKKRVVMNISDNWLFANIQDFLEEKGEPIEIQLNGKLLQIPVPYFVDLMVEVYSNDDPDFRNKVKKELIPLFKEKESLDMQKIGMSIKNAAIDISTLAVNLTTLIPQLQLIQ